MSNENKQIVASLLWALVAGCWIALFVTQSNALNSDQPPRPAPPPVEKKDAIKPPPAAPKPVPKPVPVPK